MSLIDLNTKYNTVIRIFLYSSTIWKGAFLLFHKNRTYNFYVPFFVQEYPKYERY